MLVLGGVYPKQLGLFLAIARVHPSIRPGSQPQLPVGHSFRGTGRHREDSVRCHEKPNENGQILHFQKKTAIGEFYEAVKFRTICGFLHYEH